MTTQREFQFHDDRDEALRAIDDVASGRGWVNLTPLIDDDAPDMRVNVVGLWKTYGNVVATFVTAAPRRGVAVASSLGVLHTRGRLGAERVASLVGDAGFVLRQDNAQRGVLLDVPADAPARAVLDVMCAFADALCDYDARGGWRMRVFTHA
ncbi:MAG: hypothetical protein ACRDV0_01245 [Acidimicrobiales bacterium]